MKHLKEFEVLVNTGLDGSNIVDESGYCIPKGFKLRFDDDDPIEVVPPEGSEPSTWDECLEDYAINVIVCAKCKVSLDDKPWLDWFSTLLTHTTDEVTRVTEHGKAELNSKISKVHYRGVSDEDLSRSRGCKDAKDVEGWEEGKVLTAYKVHRSRGWGRCFYQVLCEPEGAYKLIDFVGDRRDLKIGTHWVNSAAMFRDILSLDLIGLMKTQTAGRWRQGPRMTVKQWFNFPNDSDEISSARLKCVKYRDKKAS